MVKYVDVLCYKKGAHVSTRKKCAHVSTTTKCAHVSTTTKCAHVSTAKKGAHVSTKLIFLSVFYWQIGKGLLFNNLVTGLFIHKICNPVLLGVQIATLCCQVYKLNLNSVLLDNNLVYKYDPEPPYTGNKK